MEFTIKPLGAENLNSVGYLLTKGAQRDVRSGALQGLVAISEEVGIGFLLYDPQGNHWVVPFLEVATQFRNQGVGSQLVATLQNLAAGKNHNLVFPFAARDNFDPTYLFFAKQSGILLAPQQEYYALLSRADLQTGLVSFGKIPQQNTHRLLDQSPTAIRNVADRFQPLFHQAGQTLRFSPEHYSRELSFCTVNQEKITSLCLVEQERDSANLALLYSLPGHGNQAINSLLSAMKAVASQPEIAWLTMAVSTPIASQLLEKMCPNYTRTHTIYHGYF